jgi:hypothetical protein
MIFKKLGLAITFSPNALSHLKTAGRLQKLFGSQLCLIHVGEKNDESEIRMIDLINSAGIEKENYEMVWQPGDPEKVITEVCSSKQIDLLIAGALEKENIIKYYIGSVARNIMRDVSCSILILTHAYEEPKPFKKICATVQYNPLGEYSIRKGYEFAKLENAEEFILIKEFDIPGLAITISESGSIQEAEEKRIAWQNEEEQKLKVFANENNLMDEMVKTVCLYGKQGWEASNYARENGDDLLIVPSSPKRLKLFDRIFQHDMEFIFKQLPCALLIIRQGTN